MAWSSAFRERLAVGGEPMFALDFSDAPNPDMFSFRPERYVLHTHGVTSGHHIAHALLSVSAPTQSVQIRSWSPSIGAVRATLSGAHHASWIARFIPRGMLCRLKVGFAGMDYGEWGDCGIFQYKGISGARNQWVMEFGDFFGYMQSRSDTLDYLDLFEDAGTTTTTTGTFTVGAATLNTLDSTGFDYDPGQRGLLHCRPTTGDPFYMKYTSITTSHRFGLVTSDVMGTTRVNMAAGDTVTSLGYTFADIPDTWKKLLFKAVSAGTTPDGWNLQMNMDFTTVDTSDWERQRGRLHGTYGAFNIDFVTAQPLPNAWAAISEYMAAFGSWLVVRQGRLSFRAAQNIAADSSNPIYLDGTITDVDIVSVEGQTLYHPEARDDVIQFNTTGASYGDGGSAPRSLPATHIFKHPSIGKVFDDDVATTNENLAGIHIKDRLMPWHTRLPNQLRLNLAGWRWSELVPGDVVAVESDHVLDLQAPMSSILKKTINGTPFLVTSVSPDFANFTTSVELAALPPSGRA
jgi:hypothetical protein